MISEILLKRGIFKQCIYSSKSTIKYYNKSYPLKTSLDFFFGCLRLGGLHIFWWIHKDTSKFLQTNEWNMYHIQPLISMMSDKILELGRRHSLSLWRLNVMFGKALPNYDDLYYVCVCIDRALFVFQWIK